MILMTVMWYIFQTRSFKSLVRIGPSLDVVQYLAVVWPMYNQCIYTVLGMT